MKRKRACGCNSSLPLSGLSSVPDPEWLPELDWLPADEGRVSRPLSSSLLWVRSPPSELLSESLRAERDEEVLLVSLRGLLEFRPGGGRSRLTDIISRENGEMFDYRKPPPRSYTHY